MQLTAIALAIDNGYACRQQKWMVLTV